MSASASWYDGYNNFRVVGDQLLDADTGYLFSTGVWVNNVAYAARVARWDDGWLVAQFSSGTVTSAFFYDDAYGPTAASVLAQTFTWPQWPWTGNLPAASFGHTLVVGSPVVLWGEGLPVERVADEIGTIPYELITKLTSRVFMEYV